MDLVFNNDYTPLNLLVWHLLVVCVIHFKICSLAIPLAFAILV